MNKKELAKLVKRHPGLRRIIAEASLPASIVNRLIAEEVTASNNFNPQTQPLEFLKKEAEDISITPEEQLQTHAEGNEGKEDAKKILAALEILSKEQEEQLTSDQQKFIKKFLELTGEQIPKPASKDLPDIKKWDAEFRKKLKQTEEPAVKEKLLSMVLGAKNWQDLIQIFQNSTLPNVRKQAGRLKQYSISDEDWNNWKEGFKGELETAKQKADPEPTAVEEPNFEEIQKKYGETALFKAAEEPAQKALLWFFYYFENPQQIQEASSIRKLSDEVRKRIGNAMATLNKKDQEMAKLVKPLLASDDFLDAMVLATGEEPEPEVEPEKSDEEESEAKPPPKDMWTGEFDVGKYEVAHNEFKDRFLTVELLKDQSDLFQALYKEIYRFQKYESDAYEDQEEKVKAFRRPKSVGDQTQQPEPEPESQVQNESVLKEEEINIDDIDVRNVRPRSFSLLQRRIADIKEALSEYKKMADAGNVGSKILYSKYRGKIGNSAGDPKKVLYKLLLKDSVRLANTFIMKLESLEASAPKEKVQEQVSPGDDPEKQVEVDIEDLDFSGKVDMVEAATAVIIREGQNLVEKYRQSDRQAGEEMTGAKAAAELVWQEMVRIRPLFPAIKPFKGSEGFAAVMSQFNKGTDRLLTVMASIASSEKWEDIDSQLVREVKDQMKQYVSMIKEVFAANYTMKNKVAYSEAGDNLADEDPNMKRMGEEEAEEKKKEQQTQIEKNKAKLNEKHVKQIEQIELNLYKFRNFYGILKLFYANYSSLQGQKSDEGELAVLFNMLTDSSGGEIKTGDKTIASKLRKFKQYFGKFDRWLQRLSNQAQINPEKFARQGDERAESGLPEPQQVQENEEEAQSEGPNKNAQIEEIFSQIKNIIGDYEKLKILVEETLSAKNFNPVEYTRALEIMQAKRDPQNLRQQILELASSLKNLNPELKKDMIAMMTKSAKPVKQPSKANDNIVPGGNTGIEIALSDNMNPGMVYFVKNALDLRTFAAFISGIPQKNKEIYLQNHKDKEQLERPGKYSPEQVKKAYEEVVRVWTDNEEFANSFWNSQDVPKPAKYNIWYQSIIKGESDENSITRALKKIVKKLNPTTDSNLLENRLALLLRPLIVEVMESENNQAPNAPDVYKQWATNYNINVELTEAENQAMNAWLNLPGPLGYTNGYLLYKYIAETLKINLGQPKEQFAEKVTFIEDIDNAKVGDYYYKKTSPEYYFKVEEVGKVNKYDKQIVIIKKLETGETYEFTRENWKKANIIEVDPSSLSKDMTENSHLEERLVRLIIPLVKKTLKGD